MKAERTLQARHAGFRPERPLRVLLVGGGHANIALLKAARRWTARGVEVTLINDTRHLLYSGMTPEYLGGAYRLSEIRIDLLRWCLAARVRFLQTRATGIDLKRRTVLTEEGTAVACDLAVFDVGATNPRQARAGNAVLTKPLHHVLRLERWLADVLSREQPVRSLVIVGGGSAGCEVMLNVSARLQRSARPHALRLTLLHAGQTLMPQFAPPLGRRAGQLLRARGVDVRLGAQVEQVEDGVVRLQNGERVAQDQVVWATGTSGQPLFADSGLAVDERGYVWVDGFLRVPGEPWLFAAGDCARMEGPMLERSGVNAVKQGLTLRANMERLVDAWQAGKGPDTVGLAAFKAYPVAPYLLSTGEREALLALGPHLGLRGSLLLTLKHLADRVWIGRYQFADERGER